MKLSVNGWARDHGPKTLVTGEVELEPTAKPLKLNERRAHGWRSWKKKSGVTIAMGVADVRLTGDYLLTLTMSDRELAQLFFLAAGDASMSTVLDLLADAAQKTPVRNECVGEV